MLYTGLQKVEIALYATREAALPDVSTLITLDQKSGGPTEVTIQNLSATSKATYGGDGIYMVSNKGNGQVNGSFNLLDFPEADLSKLLGYIVENGITVHGTNTIPPYAAVKITTADKNGDDAWLGLPKVVFARGDINPQTNTEEQTQATDALTWTAMNAVDGAVFKSASVMGGKTAAEFEKAIFGVALPASA